METKNPQEFMQTILLPGFRFHPTDEELIMLYLKKKINSSLNFCISLIAEIDLYKFNPWELPDKALFGDDEWFFFTPRDRKYPNGVRPNRATSSRYWKATGRDKTIFSSKGSQCIGVKKSLVFYHGRPLKGSKSNWMMYEYRVLDQNDHSSRLKGSTRLDDWVLCRIRHRNDATNKFFHSNPISISSYYNHHEVEQNDVVKKPSDQSCSVETEVLGDGCVSLDLEQESSRQYFGTVITINQVIMQQYVETMEELSNIAPFKPTSADSENSDIYACNYF